MSENADNRRLAPQLQHWRCEVDAAGIAWVRFDHADLGENQLSAEALAELDQLLTALAEADRLNGVVFRSGKANGFCFNNDPQLIRELTEAESPLPLVMSGQALFDRLEQLPCPTVAAIHGPCLSGGLELALACDYRVASDAEATRLGFPEIHLGLHPRWGGTVRLPRLIGGFKALGMLLDGEAVGSEQALSLGLIDYRVPRRQLAAAARAVLRERRPRLAIDLPAQAGSLPLLRQGTAARLRKSSAERYDPLHYPAPSALIDLWERQVGDTASNLRLEAESFIYLALGETARNLTRVAMLRERLHALGQQPAEPPIRHLHVIGAGTMGGAIGAWCALHGIKVTLQDVTPRHIAAAIRRGGQLFRQRLSQPHLITAALDRMQPDPAGHALAHADLVLESIPEDPALKREVLAAAEAQLRPDALLASNSSCIPLATLATDLKAPERLVGLHFFNPVTRLPLIEVIGGETTLPAALARAHHFAGQIERLPLPTVSSPGFLINRVLSAYLDEAMRLYDEGVATPVIDETATRFGMRLGPLEMADRIGLDKCLAIAEQLEQTLGEPVPNQLPLLVAAGRLGRQSGQGFYDYKHGRPIRLAPEPTHTSRDEIGDRVLYRLFNAAIACYREGVVAEADLIDAALLFNLGFPGFRGGPLHYLRSRGVEASKHRLLELEHYYGERFRPDAGWALLEPAD